MRTKLLIVVAGLAVLLSLSGCGGSDRRVVVTGKVTVAGKGPLTGGSIQFISVADPTKLSGGQIKADGTYEVPDAPQGDCKVVIDNTHLDMTPKKTGGMPIAPTPGMKGTNPGATGPRPSDKAKMSEAPKGADIPPEMGTGKLDTGGVKYIKIDPSYTKADTTPLKATVKDGTPIDFEVK